MGLYNVAWVGVGWLILSSPFPHLLSSSSLSVPPVPRSGARLWMATAAPMPPARVVRLCRSRHRPFPRRAVAPPLAPVVGPRSHPSGNVHLRRPTSTPDGGSGPPSAHHGGAPEHGCPSPYGSASLVSISGRQLSPSLVSISSGLEEKGLRGGKAG
jgi:hypothetical protein